MKTILYNSGLRADCYYDLCYWKNEINVPISMIKSL